MQIPFEQSGFVLFLLFALIAVAGGAITWVIVIIVDEWEKADLEGERYREELENDVREARKWKS